MRKELFDELLESVREGGATLRGEKSAHRAFTFDVGSPRLAHPEQAREFVKEIIEDDCTGHDLQSSPGSSL